MRASQDEPIDLSVPLRQDSATADPWGVEQEPSNFICLWPYRHMPDVAEIRTAFERVLGSRLESIAQPDPPEPTVRWVEVLEPQDGPALIVWCEPMRAMEPRNIERLGAAQVKWVIGIETLLDRANPLRDFLSALRLLSRAIPASPAILDVNSECWHTRPELQEAILGEIDPDPSILWVAHALGAPPADASNTWVYTRGLARCGLPELEMLDVPVDQAPNATAALTGIAALVLEQGMPPPGARMEIGQELLVTFQTWREAAKYLADGAPGSMENRKDHAGRERLGASASVCGAEPVGSYRQVWSWPREVVSKAAAGDCPVYLTAAQTRRQAAVARQGWPDLIAAFAELKMQQPIDQNVAPRAAFLVSAAFASGRPAALRSGTPDREHLWFEVLALEGERALGRLRTEPAQVAQLNRGQEQWIGRSDISDWAVQIKGTRFGPRDGAALRATVAALRSSGASS